MLQKDEHIKRVNKKIIRKNLSEDTFSLTLAYLKNVVGKFANLRLYVTRMLK